MLTVTVYLNENSDYFSGFDAATARLRQATTFEVDLLVGGRGALERLLEVVFEQLNIDHPTEPWAQQYRRDRNRSLSVGDVVVIGEAAWSVARIGWEQISSTELSEAMARGPAFR